jgi:lipopolysaccharide export system protein LptC
MENQDIHTYSSFLRDNRKELAVLLLLGALAGAVYYFFSFSQPEQIKPFEEKGVLDLYQITVNDYQMERKKWKLIGKRALISEKSKRMRIEQVKIWVYAQDNSTTKSSANFSETANNSSHKIDLVITADQGLIERHDNRVTLSGNVVLLRDDGSEVFTETAIYDAKKDTLTIPKPLRMIREGHSMHGSGLIYQISTGKLNLKNPLLLRHDGATEKLN